MRAAPIGEDTGLAEIKAMVAGGLLERAEDPGRVERLDLLPAFAAHVRSFVDIASLVPMRVVADTANGVGGLVVPAVFAGLPFELSILYGELDGTFPNHPPDVMNIENLAALRQAVIGEGAAVGLAFDGDADRVVLVDDQGQVVSGSTTTAILAAAMLARYPGEAIVHNVICSKAVPEVIRELGGKPIKSRVGHSFMKQVMADTDAVLGGEHSRTTTSARTSGPTPASSPRWSCSSSCRRRALSLSELRKPFDRYAQSGEINTRVDDPLAVIERVAVVYRDGMQERLDGLTVDMGDWWFNLRPSNTEPLLRLNLEANDRPACDLHTAEVLAVVRDEH